MSHFHIIGPPFVIGQRWSCYRIKVHRSWAHLFEFVVWLVFPLILTIRIRKTNFLAHIILILRFREIKIHRDSNPKNMMDGRNIPFYRIYVGDRCFVDTGPQIAMTAQKCGSRDCFHFCYRSQTRSRSASVSCCIRPRYIMPLNSSPFLIIYHR